MAETGGPLLAKGRRLNEFFLENGIKLCALLVILLLIIIFVFVGKEAIPIFVSAEVHKEVDLGRLFLPQSPKEGEPAQFIWQPVSSIPKYSIIPLLVGTLKAAIIALLIAIPLALGAAIFTSEFAPASAREVIKPVIELLASIPSVVMGFFILIVFATWLQDLFGWTFRLNAISAGVGLGLAIIPIIYTVAEDSLTAVPASYREASEAMGADKWQTAWRIVFPAALPGIFAGCVLGFGRAIGETMIVLMASGNAAILSLNPTDSFRSFSATIAAELGEVVVGSPHYHVLFFIGSFLFVVTFLSNLAGQLYVRRLYLKISGKI